MFLDRWANRDKLTPARRKAWLPQVSVVDGDREITIRVLSTRIDPRKLHIEVVGNVLTLSGSMVDSDHSDQQSYHSFKRNIVLPEGTNYRHVHAACEGRVLTLRVGKGAPSSEERAASAMHPSKVKDIMTRGVKYVTPGMSVREAAERLKAYDIGSIPVCRDEEVVGILTDRDIASRVTAEARDPVETRVGDIMTRNVVTCTEDDILADVEQQMSTEQIRRVPVVDRNRKLVGYLTLAKIARFDHDLRSGHVLRGISDPEHRRTVEFTKSY